MSRKSILSILVVCALGLTAAQTQAEDADRKQMKDQTQKQEQIYGSQLMTPEERIQYRSQMQSLQTNEERNAFRKEHHEKMKIRAAEKGVTLPDEPPAHGKGMGPGGMDKGMGSGMGSGGGGMRQK